MARALIPGGIALAVLTLVRLAVAAVVPLAPDEAYYWIWSRALAGGYLDHPPMVALWIRAGTSLVGDTALGIRLLGPLAAALGSWMLADAAERLLPGRRAGWTAAALFNATLLMGVGSVIMTPDSPLLLFWTAALWALVRVVAGGGAPWWLAIGLFAGLALASKYTAALLIGGIGLWLLLAPAAWRWLRHPAPWAGAVLGMAVFAPVVIWNGAHGWAGFLRQGGRVGEWNPSRAVQYLGELIGSQAGLATPGVWAMCLGGMVLAAAQAWRRRDAGWVLLACLTWPPTVVFLQHATGDRVQGNWPAIIYPAATIAAAGLVGRAWIALREPALALGFGITALVYLQATTGVLGIPARFDPVAMRLGGWPELAVQVEAAREAAGAEFVAADQYALASELAWYLPGRAPVVGQEDRWALFAVPAAAGPRTGLLVRDARAGADFADAPWTDVTPLGEAIRPDAGQEPVQRFRLYRVQLGADAAGVVSLPRPR